MQSLTRTLLKSRAMVEDRWKGSWSPNAQAQWWGDQRIEYEQRHRSWHEYESWQKRSDAHGSPPSVESGLPAPETWQEGWKRSEAQWNGNEWKRDDWGAGWWHEKALDLKKAPDPHWEFPNTIAQIDCNPSTSLQNNPAFSIWIHLNFVAHRYQLSN